MQNNLSLKSALAASVGGALEWYDFIIYGFFTEVLGQQFFPQSNEYSRNLLIFGIFAMGYWARAVGGLIFGHIGDKYGRSKSLFITMLLGGVATICMAVMPNYAYLGVMASFLFVIARIVQGITIGANISGAIVYISELTSRKSRSFWISTLFLGTQRGVMLAGAVSAILFTYLTWGQLHSWGWRVAFLVGVVVTLLAWYSKWHLIETPYHLELQRDHLVAKSPVHLFFSQYKLTTIIGMGLNTIFSISITFMLFYMPTFMRDYGFTPKEVMHATFYQIFMFSLILPVFGIISDNIGPRRLLIITLVIMIVAIYPCISLIAQHDILLRYIGLTLLSFNVAAIATTIPVLLAGLFPTAVRYTGVGFSYNICQSLFAALLPLLFAMSGHHLHSQKEAVAVFFALGAVISLLTLLYVKPEHNWLWRKELAWEHKYENSN